MRRRRRSFQGALTAGLFAVYLIALSPHLVHHLFDPDHSRPACPHLAQSQQTPEIQPDPPTLAPPIPTGILGDRITTASVPSPSLPARHPRAPPASAPSA